MPLNIPAAAMIALAICNATQVQQPSKALILPSREVQIWQPSVCDAFEQTNSKRCDTCEDSSFQIAEKLSGRSVNSTVAQKQAKRSLSNKKKMNQKKRNHRATKQCGLRENLSLATLASPAPQANNQAPKTKTFSSLSVAKITKKQEAVPPLKAKYDRCNKAKNECIELQTSFPNGDTVRGLWSKIHMAPPVKRVINGMNIGLSTLGHAVRCHKEFENCMSQS
jgi:hypothetical protein